MKIFNVEWWVGLLLGVEPPPETDERAKTTEHSSYIEDKAWEDFVEGRISESEYEFIRSGAVNR